MVLTAEISEISALLANIYLCRPTREALVAWRSLLDAVPASLTHGLSAAISAIDLDAEPVLDELLWEYTRLFIGPYRLAAPPWESVYTSPKRLLMQEAHDRVQALYAAVGVQLGDAGVMPDHVGAELNFMALLGEKMRSEPGREHWYGELADRFSAEHLKRWLPAYAADLENASEASLYRELARTTRDLVSLL
jgi:anaerobic sulfite reductase subunit A